MKYFPLILRNLMRKKVRTTFTVLSIFTAFLLFGLLAAVRTGFSQGIALAGADRLMMIHKVSLIQLLPFRYQAVIENTEGVDLVTHSTWFGGYYQDVRNQFAQFAVDPERYLDMYPEYLVPEEQEKAWRSNRIGALVGRGLADTYEWELGDRIPLQGTIWRQADGNPTWEFVIEAIYDGEEGTDTNMFFLHHDYLNEAVGEFGPGFEGGETLDQVGWYIIRVEDPSRSVEIAETLDARFANSPVETKTSTEKAWVQGFADQVGNVGAIVTGITAVVFFTLLLVAGNTVAQSVRERTGELAVLKTVGFTDRRVMLLVLAESLILALVGGVPGLALARTIVGSVPLEGGFMPPFFVPPEALGLGVVFVLLLGLVTGAVPAWQALRLDIVNALRKV